MFRHINKAGQYFQDAMYIYMGDFMANEMVPDTYDTYDYTKLFGLWNGKGKGKTTKISNLNYLTS